MFTLLSLGRQVPLYEQYYLAGSITGGQGWHAVRSGARVL
jgi:hypothetical protein